MSSLPLLVATLLISPLSGHAEDFTYSAAIDVFEALLVTEEKRMNFGIIDKPRSTVTVAIASGSDDHDGANTTATIVNNQDVQRGVYTVYGSSEASINLTINDKQNIPGITFLSMDGTYGGAPVSPLNNATGGLGAPTTAGTKLILGGKLQVDASVDEGIYAPAFEIDVGYE